MTIKRRIAGLLALLMLGSLLCGALTGCSEESVSEILNFALELSDSGNSGRENGGDQLTLNEPDDPAPDETQPPQEQAAPEPAEEQPAGPSEEPAAVETQAVPEPEPGADAPAHDPEPEPEPEPVIDENGSYDDRDNVALYIHTYGKLPPNYITKKEAENLGWTGGSLERYAPGKCIGGSYFGNYEGILPKKKGREYHECDIGTIGKSSRGAKRIVYSNDGLIYYTGDHYETFELLYGEE